ncbi:alpha/beta hydrolase [Pseudonocardia abyssalis]|uniref:Alpha/beta hydrolase fold domain-containing protein n=1 Tax=Pseudonocardia abyssalis TaxID=2792008 RepID=A0ABS6V004_9PSEU|nr:alpha/beta hydrolase [Pseudonocardia abyssalis]MBW0117988.1 alpha/beta hydrolase fold domain-containing protein [Pseudonocardia abyssalis]MBW0137824.1 alpha/beta hydrolase fold domain-containing protein [Pseudonocardia abyssalis]
MSTDTTVGTAPGRLGDPSLTIGTDPRADPRMVAVFAALGIDGHADGAPLGPDAPREQLLGFVEAVEVGFEGLFAALAQDAPPVDGVSEELVTITGDGGHEIRLHVHRPDGVDGPVPCIYQVHGGGMVMLAAEGPLYTHWRRRLAAAGNVVVGVEYRNGGGVLGAHPFPSGLDDCVAGLRWVHAHLAELGGSHVVVTGDSGGANLSLALALRAKRDGWADEIAGVYAQSPYILGSWAEVPAELASLRENDRYWLNVSLFPVLGAVYDPDGAHAADPTCWPYAAGVADVEGLPPHVIAVNELDPLRDEGLAYHRLLLRAGVSSVGRTNAGLCHVGEILFPTALPDVYAAAVRDVAGFARSLS